MTTPRQIVNSLMQNGFPVQYLDGLRKLSESEFDLFQRFALTCELKVMVPLFAKLKQMSEAEWQEAIQDEFDLERSLTDLLRMFITMFVDIRSDKSIIEYSFLLTEIEKIVERHKKTTNLKQNKPQTPPINNHIPLSGTFGQIPTFDDTIRTRQSPEKPKPHANLVASYMGKPVSINPDDSYKDIQDKMLGMTDDMVTDIFASLAIQSAPKEKKQKTSDPKPEESPKKETNNILVNMQDMIKIMLGDVRPPTTKQSAPKDNSAPKEKKKKTSEPEQKTAKKTVRSEVSEEPPREPIDDYILRKLETREEIEKEKDRIKKQSDDEFEEIVIDSNPTPSN